MGKDPPAIPSVPPGLSREGDMLGKPTNLKFMDQDIIDEQTVRELARDQYSYAECILDAGTHIISNIKLHKDRPGASIRFGGYERFMTVKEKETDQDPTEREVSQNWPRIRCPN
jgi:hypothetical protein